MPLTDVTQPIAHLAQATAIVVGGAWAYAKFVRGRTFRYRAHARVEARLYRYGDDLVVHARVAMKNEGLGRIVFRDRAQRMVELDVLPADHWHPAMNLAWDEEHPAMSTPIFLGHGWVEPGETITEDLMIPVPLSDDASPPVAYQVRVWIRVPRRWRKTGPTWTANAIVPGALEAAESADPTATLIEESRTP